RRAEYVAFAVVSIDADVPAERWIVARDAGAQNSSAGTSGAYQRERRASRKRDDAGKHPPADYRSHNRITRIDGASFAERQLINVGAGEHMRVVNGAPRSLQVTVERIARGPQQIVELLAERVAQRECKTAAEPP